MYSDPKSSACQNVRKVAKELIEEWVFIGYWSKKAANQKGPYPKGCTKKAANLKSLIVLYKKKPW